MASYVELIREDVCYHDDEDASSWPSNVQTFVRSLQSNLKLPRWLRSGPVPYIDARALDLLDHLRISDDVARLEALWDSTDALIDDDLEQPLRSVFNTALTDCARIRAVVDVEYRTQTPYPKESFLAVLVSDVLLNVAPEIYSMDDVPVVFPRHFSGQTIPILKYMHKSLPAPLILAVHEEMPASDPVADHPPSDEEDEVEGSTDTYNHESSLFRHSRPATSESLNRSCTPKETVKETEKTTLPPQFEAYFVARAPPAVPPSICLVPVLCMAEGDDLPVLVSSFLYQRRVWHIADPLLAIEFSKYETTIQLYVGWLAEDTPDRVLPRVHLGAIDTPVALDLASPTVALAVARLLCGLRGHVVGVRDHLHASVGAVLGEARSDAPQYAWRIDTDPWEAQPAAKVDTAVHDLIHQWTASVNCDYEPAPAHEEAKATS